MIIRKKVARRLLAALAIGISFTTSSPAPAAAGIRDQWRPSAKTLSDYIADGFQIQTILLDRVTPVTVQATLYFLRKGDALVRCSETYTRNAGMVTNLAVGCAELGKPVTQ